MCDDPKSTGEYSGMLDRRDMIAYTAAFGTSFMAAQGLAADPADGESQAAPSPKEQRRTPRRRFDMKK